MLSINMYSLWSDETEKIIKCISEATQNIVTYSKAQNRDPEMLTELGDNLRAICCFWTGSTYVGSPKAEPIKMVFQAFFEEFMQLLLFMKTVHCHLRKGLRTLRFTGELYIAIWVKTIPLTKL